MLRSLTRKSAPTPPKRVLLAWEYGAGRTHYANLLSVAAHLRASGIECLAALYDNSAADREFAAIGVRTMQGFVWPSQRRWHANWRDTPINGFTDFLAYIGLGSSSAVTAAIAHYETLFGFFRPDLVLCEQAFGCVLAARDLIPAVALGFSGRMPPIVDGGFPLYPGRSEPVVPVPVLLEAINRGLTLAGRFPLQEIGDVLRIAAVAPLGPREFDFYDGLRAEPALPPNVAGVIEALPDKRGEEVFVYLHGFVQSHAPVMEGLVALNLPTRAYIPDLTEASRQRLTAAGIILEPHNVPLKDIFRRSRLVLHHGGVQFTAVCLAAGLPQVVLSKELDNRTAGGYVEASRLGMTRWFYGIEADWIVSAVRDCYADADLHARAEAEAPRYQKWFAEDVSLAIARRIGAILGVPVRSGQTGG